MTNKFYYRHLFGSQPPTSRTESRPLEATTQSSSHNPPYSILRANPYPEVTDLFCRLPLSTLFYQLEAVHLGDLLRLWVRLDMKTIPSCGFSRTVISAPDMTELPRSSSAKTLPLDKLIPGWYTVKKKRKLLLGLIPMSPHSVTLPWRIHIQVLEF